MGLGRSCLLKKSEVREYLTNNKVHDHEETYIIQEEL